MKTDFIDALDRHWQDAECLYGNERWANADHLYGFAAESGLKGLMLKFGMTIDETKDMPSNEKDRKHADAIWARYESYRSGHHKGADYLLSEPNPFDNWRASDRYASQSQFDRAHVTPHRHGAELVRELVKKANREGLLA
ncbi:SAM-dependent methyltransferase [Pseudomonas sp.]|jgi:hypothetical protein|uniref:SAM-dependent methyltransferase n=1 Tax=Pseudomonas sp. TaxID=306 RepID=UPI0037CBFD88